MEERWKRLLAVITLSVILPQIIVHIGSRAAASPEQTVPALPVSGPTQQIQPAPTAPEEAMSILIPVLTDENTIQQMYLEDYIRGVVLAEMPASFEMEALKAQAVAARTYALRRLRLRDKHEDGAICTNSACCQAWLSDEEYLARRGTQQDLDKVTEAVLQTAGLVVTYGGKLAETTYFSCSGGRTESAQAVWGSDIAYLQSVDSPGEEWASVFSRELYFSAEAFMDCLDRNLSGSPSQWIGSHQLTAGGGVARITIGGISYSGTELRRLLGLPSTVFSMVGDENGIIVDCRGSGHRVGMSQYGAAAMASMGFRFDEILLHYYQGTRIDKWNNIG